jgi:peptide-methionine (S)-S-oxide reductase
MPWSPGAKPWEHPDRVVCYTGAEPKEAGVSKKATFAAGCFWGVEAAFRETPGVLGTTVGYTGGRTAHPTYEQVCSHTTGHAEAVEVEFDPAQISYDKLLDVFFSIHDPTQLNRQGPDIGDQYRTAIFVHDDEQAAEAAAAKDAHAKDFARPIVTEITPAPAFYPAEDYHQRYLEKRGMASCVIPGQEVSNGR